MNAPFDASRVAEEAVQRAAEGAASEPAPTWIDDDAWIEADLPKRPWVAPGFALRGAVTLLCGPPSAMKSSTVLAWACALALGVDFGRFHPVSAEPVIVYNVEDDRIEQRRRLSATLRQFGATAVDIAGKVIRIGPNGVGTLLLRGDNGKIRFTPAMDRLEKLIVDRRPAAIIVDPLAELHNADENDNTALRAVVARFRELATTYNIAVILLHHTRKGGNASPGDPDIARGASAIIGAVRIAMTLTGMSKEDAEEFGLPTDAKARSAFVRLDDAKQNYSAIRDAEWFEKLVHVLDSGEAVPAATPWTPPETKQATQADLTALTTAIKRGSPTSEPWSPKLSADGRSIRQLLISHGFTGADAQKACMARLTNECDVKVGQFKSKVRKTTATGLHVEFAPPALWIIEGGSQ